MALSTNYNIGVLIMAAGRSARFGEPKQLAIYNGRSLVRNAVESAVAAGLKLIVAVTGHAHDQVAEELSGLPCKIFFNEEFSEGIGASIRNGLKHLLDIQSELRAVLILHADQPHINKDLVQKLVSAYSPSRSMIIASAYAGTIGVPVLLDKIYFDRLLDLKGDHGGKGILKDNPDQVVSVSFPDGAVDVDTMDDLENLGDDH